MKRPVKNLPKVTKVDATSKPSKQMSYEEKRKKALETYGSMRHWYMIH